MAKQRLRGEDLPPLPDGSQNRNPAGISFWKLLNEDFTTHDRSCMEPGFWAVAAHRLGNKRMDIHSRWLRLPLTLCYHLMTTWVHWIWGIKLSYLGGDSTPAASVGGVQPRVWFTSVAVFVRRWEASPEMSVAVFTTLWGGHVMFESELNVLNPLDLLI